MPEIVRLQPQNRPGPDFHRFICSSEEPWTPGIKRVIHPDARYLGDDAEGCCSTYECPHCGKWWREQLPE